MGTSPGSQAGRSPGSQVGTSPGSQRCLHSTASKQMRDEKAAQQLHKWRKMLGAGTNLSTMLCVLLRKWYKVLGAGTNLGTRLCVLLH